MAKLHKVEMYVLDVDENYKSLSKITTHINDRMGACLLNPFNVQTVEFDWHDEHKLNFSDASCEDYRGMFPEESEVSE